jgi:hypothetical protein
MYGCAGWKVAEGVTDSLSGAARRLTHHSEGGHPIWKRAAAYADRLGEWLREDAARLVEEATWRVQDHEAFPRGIVLS